MQISATPKPDNGPSAGTFLSGWYKAQEPCLRWMNLHFTLHFLSGSLVLCLLSNNKPRGWTRKVGKKEARFIQKLSNTPVRT